MLLLAYSFISSGKVKVLITVYHSVSIEKPPDGTTEQTFIDKYSGTRENFLCSLIISLLFLLLLSFSFTIPSPLLCTSWNCHESMKSQTCKSKLFTKSSQSLHFDTWIYLTADSCYLLLKEKSNKNTLYFFFLLLSCLAITATRQDYMIIYTQAWHTWSHELYLHTSL